MDTNSSVISGRIVSDADFRITVTGKAICSFCLAFEDSRYDQHLNSWSSYPNYITCLVFGEMAARLAPILLEDTKVRVEGRLHYSLWNKQDKSCSKIELVANTLNVLSDVVCTS